ncbi:hypothetical protein ACMGD3_02335 [Lysinibacillus sphaericus]|uniref:hypothetical protein n=1 Tax=Lysinibacillus sphaericus TaxID=1421 RepID=UPI001C6039C4
MYESYPTPITPGKGEKRLGPTAQRSGEDVNRSGVVYTAFILDAVLRTLMGF